MVHDIFADLFPMLPKFPFTEQVGFGQWKLDNGPGELGKKVTDGEADNLTPFWRPLPYLFAEQASPRRDDTDFYHETTHDSEQARKYLTPGSSKIDWFSEGWVDFQLFNSPTWSTPAEAEDPFKPRDNIHCPHTVSPSETINSSWEPSSPFLSSWSNSPTAVSHDKEVESRNEVDEGQKIQELGHSKIEKPSQDDGATHRESIGFCSAASQNRKRKRCDTPVEPPEQSEERPRKQRRRNIQITASSDLTLIQEGVNRFRCPVSRCGKVPSREAEMMRHLQTHTGKGGHMCPVCYKGFSRVDSARRHIRLTPECNDRGKKMKPIPIDKR